MLRLMAVKRYVLLLVLGLALAGCGSEAGASATPGSTDEHVVHLLGVADEAAQRNGGKALHVEAVKTTRRAAERLSGSSSSQPDVAVWVVQVTGSEYVCDGCSRPQGAAAPRGHYLTLVLTVDAYEGTSFGISSQPRNLASLGEVEVLRDER